MSTQSVALQPGTHIGDLQIGSVLGVGSFGITYLVTDPAIGTTFALKEYLPAEQVTRNENGRVEARDEASKQLFKEGLEDFLNEARIVATLDHPNIVRVLRYFEANGTAYFLMNYYRGQTLYQKLKSSNTLDPEESKKLISSLMDGLEHIHKKGVFHQDIKPANIYLSENGEPILLDFGVTAMTRGRSGFGFGVGSEGYAAAEQSGDHGTIGPWTDIYGLAATLYRCISGKIPPPAALRLAASTAGDSDPLMPLSELIPVAEYAGIKDAIELGMGLEIQDRPKDISRWRKTFTSLDWHRSVVGRKSTAALPREGREWLVFGLLAIFVVTMSGIGLYLFTDEDPQGTTSAPVTVSVDPVTPEGTPLPPAQVLPEEVERWQAALEADTVLAYRRFIDDYPESIYRGQAETQLDILDEAAWLELAAENTVEAYRDYLALFPSGVHQTEAMVRIDEIIEMKALAERQRLERERQDNEAWEQAGKTRSIAAMDQYINTWPGGLHIEQANRIRRLLQDQADDDRAFTAAKNLNTRDALQAYIDAFPAGTHITAALEHIDLLTLRPGKMFRDCPECPAMMVVPAGAFTQGSSDDSPFGLSMEKPARTVTFDEPFAVSIHEITMEQWDSCFDAQACSLRPEDNGWGRADRPVMMISWNDAQEYVQWINTRTGQQYRLPSESEWEYFARAGEKSEWLGGDVARVCAYGNIAGSETGFAWQHPQCQDTLAVGTAPVGSFSPNAFGLYDVIGNVSEWTLDCMNLSYLDAPVDGSDWGRGICSSHMTRGGSWVTGSKEIRLPARFNLNNGDRNDFTGFRVIRAIDD
jgi:formylglycine-generating enzyme required for sulfatase activity/serine/threonine protein kinase